MPRCEVGDCFKKSYNYTNCCHVPLCDDHYDVLMVKWYDNDECEWSHEEVCQTCLDINQQMCECEITN